jgi:hypothetical protein
MGFFTGKLFIKLQSSFFLLGRHLWMLPFVDNNSFRIRAKVIHGDFLWQKLNKKIVHKVRPSKNVLIEKID